MKNKLFLLMSLLFLLGCQENSRVVPINITCYDKTGGITHKLRNFKGSVELVRDSKLKGLRTEKCVLERIDD